MPLKVQLRSRVSAIEERAGTGVNDADVALMLEHDADVYKPDGSPLIMLRRRALSKDACDAAYPALYSLRNNVTDNRGTYTGRHSTSRLGKDGISHVRKDGLGSRQTRAIGPDGKIAYVASSIIGYFERQGGRFPFCRATAFTANEVEKWTACQPMIREAAALYESEAKQRYLNQMDIVARTEPDYVIAGTPFTTLTVNYNVVASVHVDKKDFKDGMGLISVLRRPNDAGHDYEGGWLVFPEYQVAVDLRDRDLILFNPHEWHGVTPMHVHGMPVHELPKDGGRPTRISVVYYFREKMTECLPLGQELARAKERGSL